MLGGQRQPQLLLQPRQCFAAGDGFARQAPVVCAPAQMLTLDDTGVDGRPRSRGRQQCLDLLRLTKDNFMRHLHSASSGAALDHLGFARDPCNLGPQSHSSKKVNFLGQYTDTMFGL